MDKFIIIEYISNYKKNHVIEKYINQTDNECLICYSTLTDKDIVMENHFCDCYHIVLLCGKCLNRWYVNDTRCFICRDKYLTYDENKSDNIFVMNPIIRYKCGLKCKQYNKILKNLLEPRSIVVPYMNDADDTDTDDTDTNDSSIVDQINDIENSNEQNDIDINQIDNDNLCVKYNHLYLAFSIIMFIFSAGFFITVFFFKI